jgi:hypothetical protein
MSHDRHRTRPSQHEIMCKHHFNPLQSKTFKKDGAYDPLLALHEPRYDDIKVLESILSRRSACTAVYQPYHQ